MKSQTSVTFVVAVLLVIFSTSDACKPAVFKTKPVEPPTGSGPADATAAPSSDGVASTTTMKPVVKHYVPSCECGLQRTKTARISGGEDTGKNEFPWQAAIVYRNTRIPFCGGTLINDRYVLTAAHCVLNLSKILLANIDNNGTIKNYTKFLVENDFQVLLNAHKLDPLTNRSRDKLYKSMFDETWGLSPEDEEQDYNEGTIRADVDERIFHPKFVDEYRKLGFDYDIALLRLKHPVILSKRTSPTPVCLPAKSELETYENKMGITVGWGRTNFRDSFSGAPVLQKLRTPVYSLDECYKISGIYVSRRFICAGHKSKSKDIGKSDSGGPLMLNKSHRYTQIGIVSWGAGEIEGHVASAFTRVSEFLPWIYERIGERHQAVHWCQEPGSAPTKPHLLQLMTPTPMTASDETTTMFMSTEATTTYDFDLDSSTNTTPEGTTPEVTTLPASEVTTTTAPETTIEVTTFVVDTDTTTPAPGPTRDEEQTTRSLPIRKQENEREVSTTPSNGESTTENTTEATTRASEEQDEGSTLLPPITIASYITNRLLPLVATPPLSPVNDDF